MAEYISRETLLKAVEKIDRIDKETSTQYEYDKEGYILLIQNAPAAEVAEVVRCEKCKHWERFSKNPSLGNCSNEENGLFEFTKPTDFCSYGEKRE